MSSEIEEEIFTLTRAFEVKVTDSSLAGTPAPPAPPCVSDQLAASFQFPFSGPTQNFGAAAQVMQRQIRKRTSMGLEMAIPARKRLEGLGINTRFFRRQGRVEHSKNHSAGPAMF